MSWNKNTVDKSQVTHTMKLLDELEIPYKVTVLGEIDGMGLNDDYGRNGKPYTARRLEFSKFVMLERMERSNDCDSDDYFVSERFRLADAPSNEEWEIIRQEPDYDYGNFYDEGNYDHEY